jgi:hypothetical protein
LLLGFDSPIEAGILLAVIILWVRFTAWPLSSFPKKGVVNARAEGVRLMFVDFSRCNAQRTRPNANARRN